MNTWLKRWFRSSPTRTICNNRRVRPALEILEDRTVPANSFLHTATDTLLLQLTTPETEVTLSGGILTITDINGGTSHDDLTINFSAGNYTITDGGGLELTTTIAGATGAGTSTLVIPSTGVTGIAVVAAEGDDDSILVQGVQAPLPAGLSIAADAGFDAVVVEADLNTGAGDIDISLTSGDAVTFAGLTPCTVAPAGVLMIWGGAAFADGEGFAVEIGGTTPGTDHDQLDAFESVTIGDNVWLTVTAVNGFVPTAGDSFTIIVRDGGSGTFLNLPEGATISNFLGSGLNATITYVGGDGDDVVLTAVAVPTTLVVDNTGDISDGNFAAGQLTLREAIERANQLANASTISFAPSVFGTPQTITLLNGQFTLTANMTITGPGANLLTLDANRLSRHFAVNTGVTAALSGWTLRNGTANGNGGSILNLGTLLTVADSYFVANTGGAGGAIVNLIGSELKVSNSTFSLNRANNGGGGVSNGGTATIVNSTFSGNTANASGGAIVNATAMTIANCTIVSNTAGGAGGGVLNNGTMNLNNCIIAGNSTDLSNSGGGLSAGFNLIGNSNSAGGLANGVNGNLVGVNGVGVRPLAKILEKNLADNGGPTPTHALKQSSPAINAGSDAAALAANLTTDQRGTGFSRFVDTVDIGALEQALAPARLTPDPIDPTKMALIVTGDGGDNKIRLRGTSQAGEVEVIVDGQGQGTFRPTGHVIVEGGEGADDIQVTGTKLPAWLYGGPGNDTLTSGEGDDVLLGGAGDDTLKGGNRRDLLIGGAGSDVLKGQRGQDILIAGFTPYDANTVAAQQALDALMAVWTAGAKEGYAARIVQLRDMGVGTGNSVRLNETTVSDDEVSDELHGNSTSAIEQPDVSDWFLANEDAQDRDTLVDRLPRETLTDIDPLI